jgi:DNA-directed DNA polymerase III PolC
MSPRSPAADRPAATPPLGNAPPLYAPLRVHGVHSLLTGVDRPRRLLERAAELGAPALALTDVGNLAGLVEFLQAAEALAAEGRATPRPIVGAELSDGGARPGRLVALVENAAGYRQLCKLVSAAALGADPGARGADLPGPERFDLIDAAVRHREGLVFLADHPRLLYGLKERLRDEQLFAALSPAGGGAAPRGTLARARPSARLSEAAAAEAGEPLERPRTPPPARPCPPAELNAAALSLGLASVAVPDVYAADAASARHQRARVAIKHAALECDLPAEWLAAEPFHLLEPAALARAVEGLEDSPGPLRGEPLGGDPLRRSLWIAERCRFVPPLGAVHFPAIDLEPGATPYSALVERAFDGARRRFRPLTQEVVERLQRELSAIDDLGFAAYFLLVDRIAAVARERGIPCVGRGSAADSLVAYCLGLTDADPLRYRLPFERFLNPRRRDRPDIDLDFCWRRRDELLEEVYRTFGATRTAMIATLNTFGLRAAFREMALVAGVPPVEVRRWSKRLPYASPSASFRAERFAGDPALAPNPLANALASTPECRDFPFEDPLWRRVLDGAAALVGLPRHFGLHPGGVVVAPGAITDLVPCQRAQKGVVVTQFDKDAVEAIGLVKMDLLGNRALTVIDDCLAILRARGLALDLRAQPEDEPKTAAALASGRTLACFQVESPGMRHLLQQIGARCMDQVIQAVALIRPGPAGCGMKDSFIARVHGREAARAPHPSLDAVLAETHGVMLYQEDVMQVAVCLAGLDLAQADELRRGLKDRATAPRELEQRFLAGCASRGVDPASARATWEQIANFVSFSFCKAHAVTYGQLAWRTVFLKTHFPGPYLAAFLASHTGYYEPRVYVEEARRLGVAILGPDINRSEADFALERLADGRDGLRLGLLQVKGLGERTLERLLGARMRGGAFLSLPDFLERVGPERDEAEHLIRVGALDAFDRTRPELLWRLHLLHSKPRRLPADLAREAGLDGALLAACQATPHSRAGLLPLPPPQPREAFLVAERPAAAPSDAAPASPAGHRSAAALPEARSPALPTPDPRAQRASNLRGAPSAGAPSASSTGAGGTGAGSTGAGGTSASSTGGWGQSGLGLGRSDLAPGASLRLFADPPTPALALPRLPDAAPDEQALEELELLGLTLRLHPTRLFPRSDLPARLLAELERQRVPCADLQRHAGRRVALLGWLAASRRVRTRDGRWMRFLTFEDESGLAEVVLFADAYARHGIQLTKHGPFYARGSVETQAGALSLHADWLG